MMYVEVITSQISVIFESQCRPTSQRRHICLFVASGATFSQHIRRDANFYFRNLLVLLS